MIDRDQTIERSVAAQINLYYDVVLPQTRPAPLLIALHGYGAGKWHATREARLIVPDGFAIASLKVRISICGTRRVRAARCVLVSVG